MLRGKLQSVSVTGNDRHNQPFLLAHTGNRTQKVICLQTFLLDDLNIHCLQHFLDHRHLLPKLFCHRFTRAFVLRKHLVAESRRMHVKRDRQILRFLLIQYLKHDI